jgi:hypothetical protein
VLDDLLPLLFSPLVVFKEPIKYRHIQTLLGEAGGRRFLKFLLCPYKRVRLDMMLINRNKR